MTRVSGGVVYLATVAAVGVASPALAQADGGPQRASTDGGDQAPVGDIIVTARRREESLQNVPVAVTALGGAEIERRHIETATDLQNYVPSLNVSSSFNRDDVTFTIRGLGPTGGSGPGAVLGGGGAGVVSYFAETVATGSGPGLFYDLENVQVLKGPQGTLFGKNTTGGAVLFTPSRPRDDFEGYLQASYGNLGSLRLGGVLNVPVVSGKLLVRFSFQRERSDGFTIDRGPLFAGKDYDNRDYWAGRLSLLFKPFGWFENSTILSFLDSRQNGDGYILSAANPQNPNGAALLPFLAEQQAAGIRSASFSTDSIDKRRNYGVVNTSTFTLGHGLILKNIFSYQVQKIQNANDLDATPLAITDLVGRLSDWHTQTGTLTEELQLQAKALDDKLQVTTGVYYERSHDIAPQPFRVIAAFGNVDVRQPRQTNSATSLGVYGQATLDLGALSNALDGLNLTGGYRKTWDRYSYGVALYTPSFGNICLSGAGTYPQNDCFIFNRGRNQGDSWTAGLDYHLARNTLVYVRSSHGYVPGGFNPALAYVPGGTDLPQFRFAPQTATDMEAGIKASTGFAGGHASFAADIFRTNFSNIQRLVALTLPNGINSNFTANASEARIWGIELEGALELNVGLRLEANYSYNEGKYTRIDPAAAPSLVGIPFGYLPKHKVSVSVNYDFVKSDSVGRIGGRLNYSYQSRYFGAPAVQPLDYISAFSLINLGLDWDRIAGSHLDASLFVNNLTNKRYRVGQYSSYADSGEVISLYGAPRTYGLQLRYRF